MRSSLLTSTETVGEICSLCWSVIVDYSFYLLLVWLWFRLWRMIGGRIIGIGRCAEWPLGWRSVEYADVALDAGCAAIAQDCFGGLVVAGYFDGNNGMTCFQFFLVVASFRIGYAKAGESSKNATCCGTQRGTRCENATCDCRARSEEH